MKKYLFFFTIGIFATIVPLNSSTREEYIYKKNSFWSPSGLDINWSIDLTNRRYNFLNRHQDTFFHQAKDIRLRDLKANVVILRININGTDV